MFDKIDNFCIENFKNKNFHIYLFTTIVSLPIAIYMLVAFSISCKHNKISVPYNSNELDCYCQNFVTPESLQIYISKNEPFMLQDNVAIIDQYEKQFDIIIKSNIQSMIDIVFDVDKLNINIPSSINDTPFQLTQAISLIPLVEFDNLEESLRLKAFNLNTTTFGYATFISFQYGAIPTYCFLTNVPHQEIGDYYLVLHFSLYPYFLDLDNNLNILCFQPYENIINGHYVFNNGTILDQLMSSPQFQNLFSDLNSSIVAQVDKLFDYHNPGYCIPSYCLKSDCLGYPLYSAIVITATIISFIYKFFSFIIMLYFQRQEPTKNIQLTQIVTAT